MTNCFFVKGGGGGGERGERGQGEERVLISNCNRVPVGIQLRKPCSSKSF